MKFLSVRDLRSKSAEIWRELPQEGEMVVTSNGHPVALLTAVDESSLELILNSWKQVRATRAIVDIQTSSVQAGKDSIPMEEINSEIGEYRKERRKRAE